MALFCAFGGFHRLASRAGDAIFFFLHVHLTTKRDLSVSQLTDQAAMIWRKWAEDVA